MIYYLLLALSVCFAVGKSSVYNAFAKARTPGIVGVLSFNAVSYGTAAVIALAVMLTGGCRISVPTVLSALLYAVTVFSLQTVSILAMKRGDMALTSVSVMYGMIIPALAGPLFWNEPFGVLQGVGILLVVGSLGLLGGAGGVRIVRAWIPMAVAAFLLSGMAGISEKIHQSTEGRDERGQFVFLACAMMLLLSLSARALLRKRSKETAASVKPLLLLGGVSGAIVGFYSIVNLTLAGALDTMIYYPVANGGALLLTVAVSRLVFGEPLGRGRAVGFLLGLAGILCLSLPI